MYTHRRSKIGMITYCSPTKYYNELHASVHSVVYGCCPAAHDSSRPRFRSPVVLSSAPTVRSNLTRGTNGLRWYIIYTCYAIQLTQKEEKNVL